MREAMCCGVLGAEIDVGDDAIKQQYCPVTVSGCKYVVEYHSRMLRKYPLFLIAKLAALLILTWFSFGSIVGEPTDNQGNNYYTHGDIAADKKEAASDDDTHADEDEDDDA
ncbi:uncharacterized protein LOC142344111 [Convolutriloba macropyga]|uniref:uncharacterized protein LOC142344111 n=1 Tax=Convolutriloba macropyga TaxID=536237 RepID=UPI003F51E577